MSNTIISTQDIGNAASTPTVDMSGFGSTLLVTSTGLVAATAQGSVAIQAGDSSDIHIFGTVYSAVADAIDISGSGDTVIQIGSTGSVSSGSLGISGGESASYVTIENDGTIQSRAAGIQLYGYQAQITNKGTINSVYDNSIYVTGFQTTINNSGSITAQFGSGVVMNGGSESLVNSGEITGGEGQGIYISNGSSIDQIRNSGTITGTYYPAIQATSISSGGNGGVVLTNSGTIQALGVQQFPAGNTRASGAPVSYASVDAIQLSDGVDNVVNTGTILGNTRLGDGDDVFDGSVGVINGTVFGEGGADTLYGGNSTNDFLDGGAGADYLNGGTGEDTAVYGDANAAVWADIRYFGNNKGDAAGDTYLSIEDLTGSSYNDTLLGDAGVNTLNGSDGDDTLLGREGNDFIYGGTGNDVINGGVGDDYMVGGDGTDTLSYSDATAGITISLASTAAQATGSSGTDTVLGFEKITGSNYNDVLTGDAGVNTISGGAGDDRIDGGLGSDNLTGGAGKDTFVFDTALGASNVDTIVSFTVADDLIALDRSIFTQFGASGALPAGAFGIGTAATTSSQRIVYNASTGDIYYDADGSGSGAAVKFAHISAGLALTASNFTVVG